MHFFTAPGALVGLECQRGRYGGGSSIELGQKCVAPDFSNAATIPGNDASESLERIVHQRVREVLVLLHQRGRTGDVGVQYDDEPVSACCRPGVIRSLRSGKWC
jgi:hypothetical protein